MRGNQGFTFVEIMIATALASLAALGLGAIVDFIARNDRILKEKNNAEMNALLAVQYMQITLQQGSNVALSTGSIDGTTISATGDGYLRTFNPGSPPIDGSVVTIAAFQREDGPLVTSAGALSNSRFLPTGIFYQAPTPTTSGVLYFDTNGSGSGSTFTVKASYAKPFIDRIVEFKIDPSKVETASNNHIRSLEAEVTTRYFESAAFTKWRWCPPSVASSNSSCAMNFPYKDIKKTFRIVFHNNRLPSNSGNSGPSRALGGIYFFKLNLPNTF